MRRAPRALPPFAYALVSLCACSAASEAPREQAPPPPSEATAGGEFLSPTAHLVRASITLRARRPSVEELRAVAADPGALPGIVDRYLASPEFGATVRELHDDALRVKVGTVVRPAGFPVRGSLSDTDATALNDAVTDAPLRLIEHVVTNDRPYSEIVTADYTVANSIVARVWGLERDGDSAAWTRARHRDSREHAGILSDSFLFTRHSTTYSNANRGRANAISSALLCNDWLTRDISIDSSVNLADPAAVESATKTNAACASCHQALDPMAAYFAAFRPIFTPSFEARYPIVFDTAPLAPVFRAAEPAYFGHAGRGLRFLGAMIAQDPRFSLCAARRFYAYLNQVSLERVPDARAAELQGVFVGAQLSAKALARAIVLSDDFRASRPHADGTSALRKLRPRALSTIVEDLTGFRWETELGPLGDGGPYDPGRIGRVPLLTDSFFGYSVLFGGTDGDYVTQPSHTMNATSAAVLRALAARAGAHVVSPDASSEGVSAPPEGDGDEASLRGRIADLHARFFGEIVAPSSEPVEATLRLHREALAASGDATRAWSIVVYAMLQDPRFLFY